MFGLKLNIPNVTPLDHFFLGEMGQPLILANVSRNVLGLFLNGSVSCAVQFNMKPEYAIYSIITQSNILVFFVIIIKYR